MYVPPAPVRPDRLAGCGRQSQSPSFSLRTIRQASNENAAITNPRKTQNPANPRAYDTCCGSFKSAVKDMPFMATQKQTKANAAAAYMVIWANKTDP